MIVYVAQESYPNVELKGSVLAVGSEWNRIMHEVMGHYGLDQYMSKTKVDDRTWRIHVDGDLYVDVIKFTVDAQIPNS